METPKFVVGQTVTYLEKKHIISQIINHSKGFLYMFEDLPLAVIEGVLTGELESQCCRVDPEAPDGD